MSANSFPSDLLVRPASLRNKDGRGLRVFTPFWKRVLSMGDPPQPLPAPKKLKPGPEVASDDLTSWNLEPTHPDWASGLRETWVAGESAAQERLHDFLENGIKGYASLIATAPRDSRLTFASVKSARVRSGTLRISPRHKNLPSPATLENS